MKIKRTLPYIFLISALTFCLFTVAHGQVRLTDNSLREGGPIITEDGQYVAFYQRDPSIPEFRMIIMELSGPSVVFETMSSDHVPPNISVTQPIAIDGGQYHLFSYAIRRTQHEAYGTAIPIPPTPGPELNFPYTSSAVGEDANFGRVSGDGYFLTFITSNEPSGWAERMTWEVELRSRVAGSPTFFTTATNKVTNDTEVQTSTSVSNNKKVVFIERERLVDTDLWEWDIVLVSSSPRQVIGKLLQNRRELPVPLTPLCGTHILNPRKALISNNGEVVVYNSNYELFAIDLEPSIGTPRPLVTGSLVFDFSLSNNGNLVVYSTRDDLSSPANIYWITSDGTLGPFQVTDSLFDDTEPRISDDGTRIVFVRKTYLFNPCAFASNEIYILGL